jgi:assimilatory nitrate reductase catalytic subunit
MTQLTDIVQNRAMAQKPNIKQTTCAYCGVGCGIDIAVSQGYPQSLSATKEHPANFGRLCVKGTNLLETTSHHGRLLTPEIHGKKVNWQQANNYIASQFQQIIKQYGSNAIAFYVSGQLLTEDYYVANKLMKGYLGSANIDTNSRLCMSSAVAAYQRAFGEDVVPCNYSDIEQADLLLLCGANTAWTHPVLFQRIEQAKKRNPNFKLVVIDPRKTATAQSSDHFLALKPGSDGAFFNGLLNYIADKGYLDQDFISRHTQGFEQALSAAKLWDLETTARYCQLSVAQLSKVYQLFCQSKRPLTCYSMGINQSNSGTDKCNAIINVHLATNKIGKPGCGPFSLTGQPNAMGGREVGGMASMLAAHMDIEEPEHRQAVQNFWQSPKIANEAGYKAVEMFEKVQSGEIKAIWIMATNPMVSMPERDKIAKALTQCPLVIVSDCVKDNDTLSYADVKLPATTWLEKNGTVTNSERRISRQRGVVDPPGEARHDWQIISSIAKAMGFAGFDYQHPHEIFCEHARLTGIANDGRRQLDLSALATLKLSEYNQLKPVQWPITVHNKPVFADGKFSTPSGKANFIAITPKPVEGESTKGFPLTLNSGRVRDHWHSMTRTSKAAALNRHTTLPFLSVNKLQSSPLVKINSALGWALVWLKSDSDIRQGDCFMPIHWNKQFASQANVSALYQSVIDPLSGQPQSKQVQVRLAPYPCNQYISLYLPNDSATKFIRKLEAQDSHWFKIQGSQFTCFQIARKKACDNFLLWCQQVVPVKGQWLSFQSTPLSRVACIQENKLVFYADINTNFSSNELDWLTANMAESALAMTDIQLLLAGEKSAEFKLGRQICSCFNVREKTIAKAIRSGSDSLEKLGKKLKCGSRCGSCQPELRALLNHSCSTNKSIVNKSDLTILA